MGKHHLKRLAAPKTWQISRKGIKFITRPVPGPHNLETAVPISILLKEIMKHANTTGDAKKILKLNEIKIYGKARKDFRFPVGIFDTIEFTSLNKYFRLILNKKGTLDLIRINKEEALLKPCKIIRKTMVRGKLQLNLYDGKNVYVNSNTYKVGDTVLLSLPEHKISKHLKLDKKSTIFLIGGRHTGEIGNVEDIIEDRIIYKNQKGNLIETSKSYAFVVGGNEPVISLHEDEPNERHKN